MLYPCPQCQKLFAPGSRCKHCGYLQRDDGLAIVSWLAQMTREQRSAAIAAEPAGNWPGSLTRQYPGRDPARVLPVRDYEAGLLAEAGYAIAEQSWAGGGATIGDFARYGLIGVALKDDSTALIVRYDRQIAT